MRLLCACLLLSAVGTSVVAAQAHPSTVQSPPQATPPTPAPKQAPNPERAGRVSTDAAPTVVVVMESAGGVRAAAELRKALSATGCAVFSLTEAKRRGIVPDALLTIGTGGAQTLQVVYWERDGATDALSAPSPGTAEQLHAVLVAMSSALIERHRTAAAPMAREVLARTRIFDDARAPARAYAMLSAAGRLHHPRTNVFLRYDEF